MEQTPADRAALSHLQPVEPDHLRQSGEEMTEAQQVDWFTAAALEFSREGATHFRYSIHPEIPHLRLVEGWKVRPANEGEPRWQLQAG